MKVPKERKERKEYKIGRKSDGKIVYPSVWAYSKKQAAGYYVAKVIKQAYRDKEFVATLVE